MIYRGWQVWFHILTWCIAIGNCRLFSVGLEVEAYICVCSMATQCKFPPVPDQLQRKTTDLPKLIQNKSAPVQLSLT